MATTLTEDQCRAIAEAHAEYLTAVGRQVPSGPPANPERFHYSYSLDADTPPLRLADGWAFHVHGNLTGMTMEDSVAVMDAGGFDGASHAFLCGLSPHRPDGWSEGNSFIGMWEERYRQPSAGE